MTDPKLGRRKADKGELWGEIINLDDSREILFAQVSLISQME